MNDMRIEQIDNGYIITDGIWTPVKRMAFTTLDDAFAHMLHRFESRYPAGMGGSYGHVVIERGRKCIAHPEYPEREAQNENEWGPVLK